MRFLFIIVSLFTFSRAFAAADDMIRQSLDRAQRGGSGMDSASIRKMQSKIVVIYSRELGDGSERCEGNYTMKGELTTLRCEVELGAGAAAEGDAKRVQVKITRTYDRQGALKKVLGHKKVELTSKAKPAETKVIETPNDEEVRKLSRPLLKIDASILKVLGK